MVGGREIPGRGAARHEELVVKGPGPEGDLPVGRPRRHVEGAWDQDESRSKISHDLGLLLQADIKTDHEAYGAELRFKHCDLIAGCQGLRFHEADAAFDVDIEQMHFAVAGSLIALAVKHIGSVVDPAVFLLRHRTRTKPDAMAPGHALKPLPGGSAPLLRVNGEVFAVIGADKDLRQKDQICTGFQPLLEPLLQLIQIILHPVMDPGLEQSQIDDVHSLPPHGLPKSPILPERTDLSGSGRCLIGIYQFFVIIPHFLKDESKIKWSRALTNSFNRKEMLQINPNNLTQTMYRPFTKKWVYFDKAIIEMPSRYYNIQGNTGKIIYVQGQGSTNNFSSLMIDVIPTLDLLSKGKGFPVYRGTDNHGVVPNINEQYKKNQDFDDEDVMNYSYAILHSTEYNEKYQNDLLKAFPRIPVLKNKETFVEAGRKLSELHLNYEAVPSLPEVTVEIKRTPPNYQVEKMRFTKKTENGKKVDDKSTIVFNNHITISNIPEKAYEYVVNGRSAIEWIMESYQIKVDKASGIKDDPNDYSEDPKYILNLLLSIINVSVQTVDIVNSMPPMEIVEQ